MGTRVAGLLGNLPCPLIACARGSDLRSRLPGRGPWRRLESLALRRACRRSAGVAAASLDMVRWAASRGVAGDRLFVSYPAFDLSWAAGDAAEPRGPEAPPAVLTVARLTRQKRVDVVLRAAAEARSRVPGLRCTVVGDGPERGRLEGTRLGAGPRRPGELHRVPAPALGGPARRVPPGHGLRPRQRRRGAGQRLPRGRRLRPAERRRRRRRDAGGHPPRAHGVAGAGRRSGRPQPGAWSTCSRTTRRGGAWGGRRASGSSGSSASRPWAGARPRWWRAVIVRRASAPRAAVTTAGLDPSASGREPSREAEDDLRDLAGGALVVLAGKAARLSRGAFLLGGHAALRPRGDGALLDGLGGLLRPQHPGPLRAAARRRLPGHRRPRRGGPGAGRAPPSPPDCCWPPARASPWPPWPP